MKRRKNEQGMALVLVLLILVVGVVLITALMMISRSENDQAIDQAQNMKAYYIARAGADMMVSRLTSIDDEYWDDFTTTHTTNPISFGDGSFVVSVRRIIDISLNKDIFEVVSTGTYQNEKKEVKAVLQYNPNTKMEYLIYSKKSMVDQQIDVLNGVVGSGGEVTFIPAHEFDDKVYKEQKEFKIYNLDYSAKSTLPDGGSPANTDVNTTASTAYNSITIASNPHKSWTINTANADFIREKTGNDYKMVKTSAAPNWMIVELKGVSALKGDIVVTGSNNLMLFVDEQLIIEGNLNLSGFSGNMEIHVIDTPDNIAESSDAYNDSPNYDLILSSPSLAMTAPTKLNIYMYKDTQLLVDVNGTLRANIIGPDAQVDLKNGETDFHGSVYAEYVNADANPSFYYEDPTSGNPVLMPSIQLKYWE